MQKINTQKLFLFLLLVTIPAFFTSLIACDSSSVTMDGIADNGNGTYDVDFTICFAGNTTSGSNGPSHGVEITITGTTVASTSPTSLTSSNTTTINSSISAGVVSYGDWSDGITNFVTQTDPQQCFNITLTLNGYPTDWEVYGQEYYEITTGPPVNQGPAGCEVIGTFPPNCPADAGTNTSAALINVCGGQDTNVSATGTTNTNIGADPCIGWGYWVANDPLGVFTGLAGIGNLPTGGMPTDDPNYVGTWTSLDYPLANGENAVLPAEDNGVTYYIAPVTLSNCQTGEINSGCFDVGNPTQIYFNPVIVYVTEISCDNSSTPTVQVSVTVSGGNPSVVGNNFTITNDGDGNTPSPSTVADGGAFIINNIPDGGDISFTITDALSCTESVVVATNVDASTYCNNCGTDAGTTTSTQTGNGNTTSNNGNGSQGPFVLCHDDQLSLVSNGDFILPPGAFSGSAPPTDDGTPGLMYTMYSDVPSTGSYATDPAWTNIFFTGDPWNFNNDGEVEQIFECLTISPFSNHTFWAVPIAADAVDFPNADGDGDGCFDEGAPIQITLLPEILAYANDFCNGVVVSISGGSPAVFGGNFTITNTGSGTLSATSIQNEGTIQLSDMTNGQTWSITVDDANGCPATFSGTYNFSEPIVTFGTLAANYCEEDAAVTLTGSPLPGGIIPAPQSYTINIIGDGFFDEVEWEITNGAGTVLASSGGFVNLGVGEHLSSIAGPFTTDDCPLTFTITDAFSDGQGGCALFGSFGTVDGCFEVIDNVTGSVIGGQCGDWGASQSFGLTCTDEYNVTATFTGAGINDNGNGTATFTPEDAGGGTHDITYTVLYDNGECSYTDIQSVEVYHTPVAILSGGETFCTAAFTTPISISFDDDATAPYTFVYNIGGVDQPSITTSLNPYTFTPSVAGTYAMTSFSDDNCDGNGGGEAIYTILNNMTVEASNDLTLCEGHTAYLGADASGGDVILDTDYTYTWDNGLGTGKIHTVTVGASNITYTVTVTDLSMCTATTQVIITSEVDDAPTITCPSNITETNSGVCDINTTLLEPTYTDDCAPPTLTADNGVVLNYYGMYNGHYYYVTSVDVTPTNMGVATEQEAMAAVQTAAQQFVGANAYIATVNDAAENDFITNMGHYYGNLIIGLTDEIVEGSYGWYGNCCAGGNDPLTYTNWNIGEPNNAAAGVGEDYVEIQVSGGVWNDISLLNSFRPAVVEFAQMPQDVTISCTPGNPFAVGTTTVTCTATDWGGNTDDCTYDVTLEYPPVSFKR